MAPCTNCDDQFLSELPCACVPPPIDCPAGYHSFLYGVDSDGDGIDDVWTAVCVNDSSLCSLISLLPDGTPTNQSKLVGEGCELFSIDDLVCAVISNLPDGGDLPAGIKIVGEDCQLYNISVVLPPTNPDYRADDCTTTYSCGDMCLIWTYSPTPGATYEVREGATVLGTSIDNDFLITGASAGSHTYSIYAVVAGSYSAPLNINVTIVACASICTTIITNQNCFQQWTGAPFPYGTCAGIYGPCIGCSATNSNATIVSPTGNYTVSISTAIGTQPQHVGAVWAADLYIDGVFEIQIATCVLTDPVDAILTGSAIGTTTPGSHLLQIFYRQVSGAPGYPNTLAEQKSATIQYCPY